MSTRTLDTDGKRRSANEEAKLYIMRLMQRPTSAVRYVGRKRNDALRMKNIKLKYVSVYHGT